MLALGRRLRDRGFVAALLTCGHLPLGRIDVS